MQSLLTKLLSDSGVFARRIKALLNIYFVYAAMFCFLLGVISMSIIGFRASYFVPFACAVFVLLVVSLLSRFAEILLLIFYILGFAWGGMAVLQTESFAVAADEAVFFDGRVIEVFSTDENYFSQLAEYESSGYSFVIQGVDMNGWHGRLLVFGSTVQPQVGDKLHVTGIVKEFSETSNFNLSGNNYFRNNGIAAAVKPTPDGISFTKLVSKYSPTRIGTVVREKVFAALEALPTLQQALIKGIAFGRTDMLTNGQTGVLQQTGIMHVFAVSGLHVGYVVMLAWAIFEFIRRRLGLNYNFALVGTALSVGMFGFVVGFSPSLLRAVVMCLASLLSLHLAKEHHASYALVVAAFLLLLKEPLWIFQAGFLLSFAATAGIVYTAKYWEKLIPNKALAAGFAAQFLTMPLLAYFFNTLSFIGLLISPLVAFGAGVVVILVLLAMLLSFVGLAYIPLVGAGLLAEYMYKAVGLLSALPKAFVYTGSPSVACLVLYYILVFTAYHFLARVKNADEMESSQSDA
jgi:competence protein ComEC